MAEPIQDKWSKYSNAQKKQTPNVEFQVDGSSISTGDKWDRYTVGVTGTETMEELSMGRQLVDNLEKERLSRATKIGEPITRAAKKYINKGSEYNKNLNPYQAQHLMKQSLVDNAMSIAETAGQITDRGLASVGSGVISLLHDEGASKAFNSFMNGLKGKAMKMPGDIPREYLNGKAPKYITESAAFVTDMVTLAGLGKLVSWVGKAKPKIMNSNWKTKQVKDAFNSIDDAIAREGAKYNAVYAAKNAAGQSADDVLVSASKIREATKKLPKAVQKEFVNTKGKLKMPVKDLREMRTKITNQINDGSWVKAQQSGKGINVNQGHLMDASKELKHVILDSVDEGTASIIKKIDPIWGELQSKGRKVQKMVYDYKTKSFKSDEILGLFDKGADVTKRTTLLKPLTKHSKEFANVYGDLIQYQVRQSLKRKLKPALKMGGLAAGGYLGYRGVEALERLVE